MNGGCTELLCRQEWGTVLISVQSLPIWGGGGGGGWVPGSYA